MSALDHTPFADSSGNQVTHSPLPMPPENFASAENNPSNHFVEAWPALMESTSQGPANHLHTQNYATCNATPNSTSNHAMTVWRGINSGNGGYAAHGGFICPSQAPARPSFPEFQPSILNNNWNSRLAGGYLPHQHPVYDRHGVSHRVNYIPQMRENSVHQNIESFANGRNVHMHPRRTSTSFVPPTPFLPPQLVRAYGNPMFYQDFVYLQPLSFETLPLEHHRGPQFMSHHQIIQHIPNPVVSTLLVNQINYYFCDANLVGDNFLKSHMDDQGWVSINAVANFPRVKKLTNDIQFVLDSLKASTVVEVQGDKIRRRNEWINWIPNKNVRITHSLSPSKSSQDLLTNFQNLKIQTSTNGSEDSIFEDGTEKLKEIQNGEGTKNADSKK